MTMDRDIDTTLVRSLLRKHVGDDVADVHQLAGGFFSRAFAATAGGREYVVRINSSVHAAESFAKDDYAWRHWASPALPIPRIVATGVTVDGWYAIGEKAPGRALAELPDNERLELLPRMLDTLDAIGRANVSNTHGFGDWDESGRGRYASWRQYLAAVMDNEPDGYYESWHALFSESFLERDVYETVYRRMLRLTEHCSEERALIHNDIQFENVIADGQRVTGIIDWANALYGDPLYDVARWLWWVGQPGWYAQGDALVRARFGDALHFAERIACYQCHIGLDELRFCAKTGKQAGYDGVRDRLLALVAAVSSAD